MKVIIGIRHWFITLWKLKCDLYLDLEYTNFAYWNPFKIGNFHNIAFSYINRLEKWNVNFTSVCESTGSYILIFIQILIWRFSHFSKGLKLFSLTFIFRYLLVYYLLELFFFFFISFSFLRLIDVIPYLQLPRGKVC